MKRKTHEEYVAELAMKNPNIEAVGRYVDAKTKISHHCLIHDVYWDIQPSNALNGHGCEMCKKIKSREKRVKTHEQYVDELTIKNPTVEVIGQYVDKNTPIPHRCTVHDIYWMVSPTNALAGKGCSKCRGSKIYDQKAKVHKQYVEEVKMVNPEIVVLGTYINAKTPILHKCLIDGYQWNVAPDSILHGYGCPQCCESSGERLIRRFLQSHDILYEYQKIFPECRDIQPLPFDFYLPDYNLCIEYDGRQHYIPIERFGGEDGFKYTIKHDGIKNNYCKNNNINLLRIPYFKDAEEELNNFLFI